MKKKITLLACVILMGITTSSCANEDVYVNNSSESLKSYELKNFENAIRLIRNNDSMKKYGSSELSEHSIHILLDPSIKLLISKGFDEDEIISKNENTKIINLAFKIYYEESLKIKSQLLKLQND